MYQLRLTALARFYKNRSISA